MSRRFSLAAFCGALLTCLYAALPASANIASRDFFTSAPLVAGEIAAQAVDASSEIVVVYDECTSGELVAGEQFDATLGMYYNRARYLNPTIGRFMSADPWRGKTRNPLTLNKYAYANGNPISMRDPSGRVGLAELGAANDIAVNLSNAQVNFAIDFVSAKFDPDSASSTGWSVLASIAPAAIAGLAKKAIKIVSTMGKNGKVAYLASKVPLDKEIQAAEFLSEKLSVGIYIRGGRSAAGADMFISGTKWELKTLNAPTSNAVKDEIKAALKQSDRVVIDGRAAGLTEEEALRGIARASGVGKEPEELMIILKDDRILRIP